MSPALAFHFPFLENIPPQFVCLLEPRPGIYRVVLLRRLENGVTEPLADSVDNAELGRKASCI